MLDLGCECLEVLHLYGGQNIGLFFKKTSGAENENRLFTHYYDLRLGKFFNENLTKLNSILRDFDSLALYGGSSHAHSLMSYLDDVNIGKIRVAIDKDERRIGKYIQNSNIKIVEPNASNLKGIEAIIMAMPLYEENVMNDEIIPLVKNNNEEVSVILTALGIREIKILN